MAHRSTHTKAAEMGFVDPDGRRREPRFAVPEASRRAARTVVRRAIEAFDRDDRGTLRELLHPQVRFDPLRGMGRPAVGRSRVADAMFALKQSDLQMRIGALDALDDGRVLALGTVQRGDDAHPFAAIHEVRNGQIADVRHLYSDVELLQELGIVRAPADLALERTA